MHLHEALMSWNAWNKITVSEFPLKIQKISGPFRIEGESARKFDEAIKWQNDTNEC